SVRCAQRESDITESVRGEGKAEIKHRSVDIDLVGVNAVSTEIVEFKTRSTHAVVEGKADHSTGLNNAIVHSQGNRLTDCQLLSTAWTRKRPHGRGRVPIAGKHPPGFS